MSTLFKKKLYDFNAKILREAKQCLERRFFYLFYNNLSIYLKKKLKITYFNKFVKKLHPFYEYTNKKCLLKEQAQQEASTCIHIYPVALVSYTSSLWPQFPMPQALVRILCIQDDAISSTSMNSSPFFNFFQKSKYFFNYII